MGWAPGAVLAALSDLSFNLIGYLAVLSNDVMTGGAPPLSILFLRIVVVWHPITSWRLRTRARDEQCSHSAVKGSAVLCTRMD